MKTQGSCTYTHNYVKRVLTDCSDAGIINRSDLIEMKTQGSCTYT